VSCRGGRAEGHSLQHMTLHWKLPSTSYRGLQFHLCTRGVIYADIDIGYSGEVIVEECRLLGCYAV
jgi:hypothetical protein